MRVTSTLQAFFSQGFGRDAAANAADLVAAGVPLLYGTGSGRSATAPAVDPRELDRLANTGLGRLGALRAATESSAGAAGMRRRTGRLTGRRARRAGAAAGQPAGRARRVADAGCGVRRRAAYR